MMTNYILLAGSIVAAIFLILLMMQYLKRRKLHQLVWTVAIAFWFLATLFQFLSSPDLVGGNASLYKVFYVLSAPLVGLMGAGSLQLLAHKPWGKYFLIYVIAVSIAMIALGLTATVDEDVLTSTDYEGFEMVAGEAMPQYVRYFSPLLTIPGGLFLIGGAFFSFWLDRTRKYNLIIALGGLFPLFGGALSRTGDTTLFSAFHVTGGVLLFIGFLLSMEYIKRMREVKEEPEPSS